MRRINFESLGKWVPVIVAGIMAIGQALNEKKEAERIDDMEARLTALENGEESE